MSCRSTNAGSAFIAFSRWENGRILSDPACLSAFHELRRAFRALPDDTRPQYTREAYLLLLADMKQRIEQRTALSSKRKTSLLERLKRAEREPTPDQEMLYALHEIRARITHRSDRLQDFIRDMARRSRTPFAEVLDRFRELEAQAPRERTHRSPSGFDLLDQQSLDRYGLGREQGTAYAALQLMQETQEIEMSLFRQRAQRIQLVDYTQPIEISETGIQFLSAGYDPRNGRLELRISQNGSTRILAYRRVPEEYWQILNPNSGSAKGVEDCWRDKIRGNEKYSYASLYESLHDGVAPRCLQCGQFADTTHGCPVSVAPRDMHTWTTRSRWSNQQVVTNQLTSISPLEGAATPEQEEVTVNISLPAVKELRTAFREGPVRIRDISYRHSQLYPYRESYSVRTFTTTGDVTAWRDDDDIHLNTSELRCQCPEYLDNYTCQHIRDVEQAVRDRLGNTGAGSHRSEEERIAYLRRAQERASAASRQDWSLNPDHHREASRTWRDDAETIYSDNFDAFLTALQNAQSAATEAGGPAIPYYLENVLDGAAQRGSGKAFGLEVEYEFPQDWSPQQRQEANSRIAARLYEARLTWSDRQQPYQSSKARGFRDRQQEPSGEGNWTLEKDGSVNGGELISPGLYDEPETWTNLSQALKIIQEEGGISSKKAGLHVHVGTSDFNRDPAAYTELARLITQHEDVIYRLSSDPFRGTHRKGRFARPIPDVPPDGFTDAAELSRWQGMGKYWAVNFNAVRGGPSDHPEFRVFDSSLDAGTIQAQVKLSIALTEAAKRHAAAPPTKRPKEPLGSHAARRAGRRTRRAMTDEELALDSATTRSLLDTLFRRDEDKNHLVAIFAHTKWPR